MSRTKLVETATTADWSFLTEPRDDHEEWRQQMLTELWGPQEPGVNEATLAALHRRTDKVAKRYEVPTEDLFADALLHLAVRPAATHGAELTTLCYRAEGVALNLAKPVFNREAREESLEALLAAEGDQWVY